MTQSRVEPVTESEWIVGERQLLQDVAEAATELSARLNDLTAFRELPPEPTETCWLCMRPLPLPEMGDHDFGLRLPARAAIEAQARADAVAERDRLREALLGTAERRLTDSDGSPCWCVDAPWVGHPSPYSGNGGEHDDFCAKVRAALNPEDQR